MDLTLINDFITVLGQVGSKPTWNNSDVQLRTISFPRITGRKSRALQREQVVSCWLNLIFNYLPSASQPSSPSVHLCLHVHAVLSSEETVRVPSDSQEPQQVRHWGQRERVGAALQEHAMLCGLRRGRQRPAKGWRPWWERANIVNERRHCLFLRRQIRAGLPACFCVSIVVWRLESFALLQRVITRSKSIVLIRPAGQRCASMALALCVLATQTCATGTSPGTPNRTSLSSASACSILEVWAWLPVVIMTDQSYGGNNLVPLKYTWDYVPSNAHLQLCLPLRMETCYTSQSLEAKCNQN